MTFSFFDPHRLTEKAEEIAREVHALHKRRDGTPYISHPFRVVQLLRQVTDNPAMLAAGWTHDVLEMSKDWTQLRLALALTEETAQYVADLTDTTTLEDGPRALRRALDRARQSKLCANSQTIKVADIYANIESLALDNDAKFSALYLREKALALVALNNAHPLLLGQAFALITQQAQLAKVTVFESDLVFLAAP